MGGPKGNQRGRKTHRADQLLNRGERKEAAPVRDPARGEDVESRRQEQAREERPTRKTARGHRAGADRGR